MDRLLKSETLLSSTVATKSSGMENMRKKQLEGKFFEIPRCRNCEMATNGDEGIPTQFEKYGPTL